MSFMDSVSASFNVTVPVYRIMLAPSPVGQEESGQPYLWPATGLSHHIQAHFTYTAATSGISHGTLHLLLGNIVPSSPKVVPGVKRGGGTTWVFGTWSDKSWRPTGLCMRLGCQLTGGIFSAGTHANVHLSQRHSLYKAGYELGTQKYLLLALVCLVPCPLHSLRMRDQRVDTMLPM